MDESNTNGERHAAIAEELYYAYRDRDPISPPLERSLTVADGYAVSQAVRDRRRASTAGAVVGYKIGFTSEAVREDLDVSEPAFGYLHAQSVSDVATIDTTAFIAPRVEPELAFVLDEQVCDPLDESGAHEVIGAVRPAIEIVDSRIEGWQFTPAEAIADNALASALRVGAPVSSTDIDLANEGVSVSIDGEVVADGRGSAVLGHPIRALCWLSEALAERDDALDPGMVISTGSITRPIPITSGTTVEVRFDTVEGMGLRVG
jgi:2-keto-4-pentenoate hydratase